MKFILVGLVLCIQSLPLIGQLDYTPFLETNKAIIKENNIKEKETYYIGSNDSSLSEIERFDINGNLIYSKSVSLNYVTNLFYTNELLDSVIFLKDNNIENFLRYKYYPIDSFGKLKKLDLLYNYVFLNRKKKLVTIIDERGYLYNWIYDKQGRLIKKKVTPDSNTGIQTTIFYYYDSKGNTSNETMFGSNNEKIREITYFYDDNKNPYLQVFRYFRNNKLVDTTVQYLTYKSNLALQNVFFNKDKITFKNNYNYSYFTK